MAMTTTAEKMLKRHYSRVKTYLSSKAQCKKWTKKRATRQRHIKSGVRLLKERTWHTHAQLNVEAKTISCRCGRSSMIAPNRAICYTYPNERDETCPHFRKVWANRTRTRITPLNVAFFIVCGHSQWHIQPRTVSVRKISISNVLTLIECTCLPINVLAIGKNGQFAEWINWVEWRIGSSVYKHISSPQIESIQPNPICSRIRNWPTNLSVVQAQFNLYHLIHLNT